MKKLIKFLLSVLILTTAFGANSFVAITNVHAANANDFYFEDATFDYYLEKTADGSNLHVREILTAVFPETNQNHGITRTIPVTNQGGKNITAENIQALNLYVSRNGTAENISKVEGGNGYYTIYIGDSSTYVHGTQIYTLEYDFKNVITEFSSNGQMTWNGEDAAFQELYWDTNGTDWKQKFKSLTANVHIPADIAKNLKSDTSCYVGRYGARNDNNENISSRCEVSLDDETTYNSLAFNSDSSKTAETIITFSTQNLSASENLSFAIDFNAGTFVVPRPKVNYLLLIFTVVETAVILVAVAYAIFRYRKTTREKAAHDKSLFVKPEYAPLKDLTVAEAKEVYLKSSKSSFVATLLELAVSRKIELIKFEKEGILKNHDAWKIKVLEAESLTKPQIAVLKILNGGSMPEANEEFEIKKHTATASLESIKRSYRTDTEQLLKTKRLFETKPMHVSMLLVMIPIVFAICYFAIVVPLVVDLPNVFEPVALSAIYLAVSIIGSIVIGAIYAKSNKYTKRTLKGIEASKYLEGLKLYITMAEADRIKFLQSVKGADTSAQGIVKLYEKLLPYACIFGVEDSWMEALNKYYKENPTIEHNWYYGTDYLTLSMFRNMVSTTSSTIVSSTSYSSSSSSGGGGGGFSGGGGGGGGGGGW